ncbi:MAG: hypothetical protein H0X42_14220 [Solirubrobacterales bacterium]|nr:hypothetical protein [Solirubrobacterales bacterium]
MSEVEERGEVEGQESRVEELLRINAALAAEIRSLSSGQTDAPRASSMPTSRRLAVILDERQTLIEQLEETRTGVAAMTASRDALAASRDELAARNQELLVQVIRLRSGYSGALRRVRARLRELRR